MGLLPSGYSRLKLLHSLLQSGFQGIHTVAAKYLSILTICLLLVNLPGLSHVDGTISLKKILVAVYTNTQNIQNDTIQIMKKHYNLTEDYVIGKTIFSEFPSHKKMVLYASIDDLKKALPNMASWDQKPDVIGYDIENWSYTPLSEQNNPPLAISNASDLVHQAGYKFGTTPVSTFILKYYQQIDWKKVDFLAIQVQRFSTNATEYGQLVQKIANFVHGVNPNTQVFAQLSFRFTDPDRFIAAVDAVKNSVDGILVTYLPSGTIPCQYCSPQNFDKVLTYIDQLNGLRIPEFPVLGVSGFILGLAIFFSVIIRRVGLSRKF